jgi:hypothetical protein
MSGMLELGSSRCLNLTAEFKFEKTDSDSNCQNDIAGTGIQPAQFFSNLNSAVRFKHLEEPSSSIPDIFLLRILPTRPESKVMQQMNRRFESPARQLKILRSVSLSTTWSVVLTMMRNSSTYY